MRPLGWFGYPQHPKAKLAWGARALFVPFTNGMDGHFRRKLIYSKKPLDILCDRQGAFLGDPPITEEEYKLFITQMNVLQVIPTLQKIATHYSTSDSLKFVKHFEWPHDPSLVLVAMGSPNGSYGYFYLSVSLVDKTEAPQEEGPNGTETLEEKSRAIEKGYRAKRKVPRLLLR